MYFLTLQRILLDLDNNSKNKTLKNKSVTNNFFFNKFNNK
jgi:hypothetical protein